MASEVLPLDGVENVTQFIAPFFNQAVYPTVVVSMGDDGVMTLTQTLSFNQSLLPESIYAYQWMIPVFYKTADMTTTKMKFLGKHLFVVLITDLWMRLQHLIVN